MIVEENVGIGEIMKEKRGEKGDERMKVDRWQKKEHNAR